MEMEERDFVTFTDDEGNEFELDVVDYFEYEDEEYAVLMDLSEECDDDACEECGRPRTEARTQHSPVIEQIDDLIDQLDRLVDGS